VVGGDEDGDARGVLAGGIVVAFAEAIDERADADNDEAQAHEEVADEEDVNDEVVEEGDEEEGDGVDCGLEMLVADERWHDLSAGFADELRDGNDGVAVGAEGFDEFRKSV